MPLSDSRLRLNAANSSDLLAELHYAPASPTWLRCCSVVASFAATGSAACWLTGFAAVASFDCPPDQRQHCRLSAPSRTGPVRDRWAQLRLLCLCFLISFLPLEVELAFFRPAGFLTLKPVPTDNKASVVPTRWSIGYSRADSAVRFLDPRRRLLKSSARGQT